MNSGRTMANAFHSFNIDRLLQMLDDGLACVNEKQISVSKMLNNKTAIDAGVREHRRRIVLWLAELNNKFDFRPETLFLSIAIFDRFLISVKAHPKYLSCIGVACFYLAAKVAEEDNMIPSTLMLVRSSECGCSVAEVLRMERCILDKLGWDLRFTTSLDFLHIYHALLMNHCPRVLDGTLLTPAQHIARLTCRLQSCLLDPQLAGFMPSTLALAVISLDLEFLGWELWLHATVTLQARAQISGRDLVWCRELVVRCLFGSMSKMRMALTATTPDQACSGLVCQKVAKRKASEVASDEFYDGIKRLYAEDMTAAIPPNDGVLMSLACAS